MEGCVFCHLLATGDPYLVTADHDVAVILDRAPVAPGHALVIPTGHVPTFDDASPAQLASVAATAQRLSQGLRSRGIADGALVLTNVIVSQSVPHWHCHVVPRHRGDGLRGLLWPRHRYASDDDVARWRTTLGELASIDL